MLEDRSDSDRTEHDRTSGRRARYTPTIMRQCQAVSNMIESRILTCRVRPCWVLCERSSSRTAGCTRIASDSAVHHCMLAGQRQKLILEELRRLRRGARERADRAALGLGDDGPPRPRRARRRRACSRRCTAARPPSAGSARTSPGFEAKSHRAAAREGGDRPRRGRARRARPGDRAHRRHDDLAARAPPPRRARPDGRHELDPGRRTSSTASRGPT